MELIILGVLALGIYVILAGVAKKSKKCEVVYLKLSQATWHHLQSRSKHKGVTLSAYVTSLCERDARRDIGGGTGGKRL